MSVWGIHLLPPAISPARAVGHHVMNISNNTRLVVLASLGFLGFALNAQAAVPTEISTALTDLAGLWDDIKELVIAIGLFVIMWKFFRKGSNKAA